MVMLGLIAVALGVAAYFGVLWWVAASEAQNFDTASVCSPAVPAPCIRHRYMVVTRTRTEFDRRTHHLYVTLATRNGTVLPEMDIVEGADESHTLQSGMEVQTTIWRGHVVEVQSTTPPVMLTSENPAVVRDRWGHYALIAAGAALLLAFIYLFRGPRQSSRRWSAAGSPVTYEFSHIGDDRD
jgi:hypothetical protein